MKVTNPRVTFVLCTSIVTLSGLLCSCLLCHKYQNQQLISNAVQLLESKPDSALQLLDSVQSGLLDQQQHARFRILKTQAGKRTGKDIFPDTIVFQARDYLVKKKDRYAGFACFVTANVNKDKGNMNEAIRDYLTAAFLEENNANYLLKRTIYYNLGQVYFLQYSFSESLHYIKKAKLYEDLIGMNRISTLELIALDYLFLSKTDSSLIFFNRALSLSFRNKDIRSQKRIVQYINAGSQETERYRLTKEKCWQAIPSTADRIKLGRIYLTLCRIYNDSGQNDSAGFYGYKAMPLIGESDNIADRTDLTLLLSVVESKKKNIVMSQHFKSLHNGYLFTRDYADKQVETALKRVRYLNLQQSGNGNSDRILIMWIMITLVLMLFPGTLLFRWYRAKQKNKLEEVKLQAEKEISSIKSKLNDERMNALFRIKDLAELKDFLAGKTNEKQLREHIKKILNYHSWDEVYPIINDMHNGLFDKIKEDFPALPEKYYRTCCLIFMDFMPSIISVILDEDTITSQNRQTKIRQKLGISKRGDIKSFFVHKYFR